MSTRSFIGMKDSSTGGIEAVYCHFDGYPLGVGSTLVNQWSSQQKLQELLNLGDLSQLGDEIGEQHDFNAQLRGACTFYGRDRREDGVNSKFFINEQEFLAGAGRFGCEYAYLFDAGVWRAWAWMDGAFEFDLSAEIHSSK